MTDNAMLVWFRRVAWVGIVANIGVALFSLAQTGTLLELLHLPQAQPPVWPRFAAFLLILLSVFYIPAALDPVANRFAAWVATACRFGGVGFFLIVGGNYLAFGLFDLVFGLPQLILLTLGLRKIGS